MSGEAGVTWGSLALSPDGRTLAVSTFMSDCGSATSSADCGGYWLWLVEVATGTVHRVGYHGRWQSFAPDGRYLAYVGFLRGDAENNVMLYDIRRATVRRLGRADVAVWAPHDDRLAFGGGTLMLFDGRTTHQLTGTDVADISETYCYCDFYLAWSPNGKELAFAYDPVPIRANRLPRLAILKLAPRRLYARRGAPALVSDPQWSPDSRELVYAAYPDAAHRNSYAAEAQLYTVSATAPPRQITSAPHPGESLDTLGWSAIGTTIRYITSPN